MKPVYQDIIELGRGNCFTACVASILELPLEEVPNFAANNPNSNMAYEDAIEQWMREHDLARFQIYIEHIDPSYLHWSILAPFNYCIMSGPSITFEGSHHAVVGRVDGWDITPVHDPNPSGKFFGPHGKPHRVTFLLSTITHKELRELREDVEKMGEVYYDTLP